MMIVILLVILDQLSKYFLGDVKNYGAAFGILQGYITLLIIASFIVIIISAYHYFKNKRLRPGLNFILAGTTGNLIDRIFLGYVRDFIDFGIFTNNLADIFNFIGVALIIYLISKR